jgi:flavin-dependent dehydrogenase
VQTDTVHMHTGSRIAPGAYAWAFPRSDRSYNAGVILGSRLRAKYNLPSLFDSFLATFYPGGTIERRFAATIPCACGRASFAAPGLIKAGDSASMVNPISRAGISEAMEAGRMAGACALEMLGAADKKGIAVACKRYEKEWFEKRGKRHQKLAKVKNSLTKVPDKDYNASARTLSGIPRDQLTMSKIFSVSLARFPRLVWALRHVL